MSPLSECTKIGRQSWVLISIIITELLIIVKFDLEVITKPLPKPILTFWIGAIILLILWTLWRFVLRNTIQILYRTPFNPAAKANAEADQAGEASANGVDPPGTPRSVKLDSKKKK